MTKSAQTAGVILYFNSVIEQALDSNENTFIHSSNQELFNMLTVELADGVSVSDTVELRKLILNRNLCPESLAQFRPKIWKLFLGVQCYFNHEEYVNKCEVNYYFSS